MASSFSTIHNIDFTISRQTGLGHIANGTICQDHCLVKVIDEETILLCVADGHGGRQYIYSDQGSELACQVLTEHIDLTTIGTKSWCLELQNAWFQAIDHIKPEDANYYQYGTTLLFAVLTPEEIICGQIGDGAILLCNDQHGILHKPAHKKTDSLTHSLVEKHVEDYFYVQRYDRDLFPYIMLSTDGAFDPFPTATGFYDFARQIKDRQTLKDYAHPFAYYDYIVNECTHDDCTYIFASSHFQAVNHFPDATLVAAQKGLVMYETEKEYIRVRKHLVMAPAGDDLISPQDVSRQNDCYIYRYSKDKDDHLWCESYLCDDYLFESERDNRMAITIHYTLKQLLALFQEKKLHCTDYLLNSLVLTASGEVRLFMDALRGPVCTYHNPLIGIVRYQDHVYPLTDQTGPGNRSIPFINLTTNEPFYQIYYHDQLHTYCLLNISDRTWIHQNSLQEFPTAYALQLCTCEMTIDNEPMHIEYFL